MAMITREEAHRILSNGLVNAPSEHEWCMAFKMAIEDLNQESILDKIRDEIEQVAEDSSRQLRWCHSLPVPAAAGQSCRRTCSRQAPAVSAY